MRKKIGLVIIILGILLCAFPSVINEITNKQMHKEIEDFIDETDNNNIIDTATLELLYQEFEKYNKQLIEEGQKLVDAFSYEDVVFDLTQYGYSENIVGYINIPKMQVTLPIYLGATKSNLRKGAALLSQTSMPIGGNSTNPVIAAHRNSIANVMFRNIQKLEIGDNIIITNAWEKLNYKVTSTRIIEPNNIDAILIQEDKEMLTLITCHPRGKNTQRYLVYAEKI